MIFRSRINKGFTLIELLAVIVILAIILVIAVPEILKIIQNVRKDAFLADARIMIGEIDTGATANASNNKWTNHPAFDFGTNKLTGIWVAKFEPSIQGGVANNTNGAETSNGEVCTSTEDNNIIGKNLVVLPNVKSWRCIGAANAFAVSREMETKTFYGWDGTGTGIDTHMMKNSEWGAIGYLSKSSYGRNNLTIYPNNSQMFYTGCSGNTSWGTPDTSNGCQYAYNTAGGMTASTTGNITGVYDIAGGSWEMVAAYINNGSAALSNLGTLVTADAKYKDIYQYGPDTEANNLALTANKKGDALFETSSGIGADTGWHGASVGFSFVDSPSLIRGGRYNNGSRSSVYYSASFYGGYKNSRTFRPIIAVHSSL